MAVAKSAFGHEHPRDRAHEAVVIRDPPARRPGGEYLVHVLARQDRLPTRPLTAEGTARKYEVAYQGLEPREVGSGARRVVIVNVGGVPCGVRDVQMHGIGLIVTQHGGDVQDPRFQELTEACVAEAHLVSETALRAVRVVATALAKAYHLPLAVTPVQLGDESLLICGPSGIVAISFTVQFIGFRKES